METNNIEQVLDKFHELRTSIKSVSQNGFPKTISVVSTVDGEGKTTVSACLGISLARQGERPLLLELNFRAPGLHDFFRQPRSAGITDVLAGKAELKDVVKQIGDIHVIFAGVSPASDPLELIESPRLKGMLEDLKNQYSPVIIDTPYLAGFKDAALLSAHADYVLFVIADGAASKEKVKECIGLLKNDRIGIVFNKERN